MSWSSDSLLFAAAAVGGLLNSVAGGGSFFTFPALLVSGVSPVSANATSAVALWPGTLASALAYRRELLGMRAVLPGLCAASLAGGLLGAIVLLRTPDATFARLVPLLMLLASLLFTFGGMATRRLAAVDRARQARPPVLLYAVQLVIATYGGYFGGGIGIMMLASFSVLGLRDIHAMNALKTLLATVINLVAIVTFFSAGAVSVRPGLVMMVAATLAGYWGATLARRTDPDKVRRVVLVVAWTLTVYFFWRTYA